MRRLARAGFKPDFVRGVVLPEWWEPACEGNPALLPEVELRVARFLNTTVQEIRNADVDLRVPLYPGARLRKVRNVDADRLSAAIHTGLKIAGAVVRCLRDSVPSPVPPPRDPIEWFREVRASGGVFDLASLARDLWSRGIPVVHVELLPPPKYQGLACICDGRPVILLGHGNDEPPRLSLNVAHEGGHLALGDCAPDEPIVDEDDGNPDTTDMERRADEFAWSTLTGGMSLPGPVKGTFREWANEAARFEARHEIDPGVLIWFWANSTGDFPTAQLALNALYRAQGGQRTLRAEFDRHVDIDQASETDRALLRCVFLDTDRDGAADRQ